MADEMRAVTKAYDFTLWLLPHLAKFSRDHRFTLGNRLEDGALEILDLLVQASYAAEKQALLRQANSRLNRVRYLLRLGTGTVLLTVSIIRKRSLPVPQIRTQGITGIAGVPPIPARQNQFGYSIKNRFS